MLWLNQNIPLRTTRALAGLSYAEVATETIAAIAKALEKAGVEFIPENGGGVPVRLTKRGRKK